ncbi:MAG: hypothetical protein FWH12_05670 [Treponema sp.]|nr:hypothetical protein [Treponema sp.]
MKKFFLLVVLAVLIQGVYVHSQMRLPEQESEFYYINVPIEQIYLYRMGYIVSYRLHNHIARTYLPYDWFQSLEGKGDITHIMRGAEWPSMTVYYRNGEFSHVRLRVRRDRAHQTWAVVPLNIDLDEYFLGVTEVRLEF